MKKADSKQRKKPKLTAVKAKHRVVLTNLAKNGGNMTQAVKDSGLYSPSVIKDTTKITNSRSWQELVEEEMPDSMLSETHIALLKSTRLDHMVFPLGPKDKDDPNFSGATPNKSQDNIPESAKERTTLTDKEIIEMLAETGCTVRRIVHGETARHVYFWAPDNMARDKALDKAYKLKKRYGDEGGVPPARGNIYNFIFGAETQGRIKALEEDIKKLLVKPNAQ